MQYLTWEELAKVDDFDCTHVIVFRYKDAIVKTKGAANRPEFRCNDKDIVDTLLNHYAVFRVDNAQLFRYCGSSGALPNENPSCFDLMLRFIRDEMKAEVVEIIPPKYGSIPPPTGTMILY